MEFKVGDKVIRSQGHQTDFWREKCKEIGKDPKGIFTIKSITDTKDYLDLMEIGTHGYGYEKFELAKGYKPKTPTHLVIWDEEDKDPTKLFTSEQEARDFVKELSEKSDVVKDSILLVEIKSVRKVTIRKSLTFGQHKI